MDSKGDTVSYLIVELDEEKQVRQMRIRIKEDPLEKLEEDKTVAIWEKKILIASLHQLKHIDFEEEF